ncbi:MAG: DUF3108 domain-containing protein [Bacteroides sp.]|nr:DUF3108 domain-containing protein [Bacteroides sp.]
MKKLLLLIVIALSSLGAKAQNIPYQELRYDIHYHWGLINVQIAHALVTLNADNGNFSATLDGNSIPWEGRVMCVSDTLRANMSGSGAASRENISYINGWYMKPKTSVFNSSSFDPQNPANYKNILGGGTLNADSSTMEAIDVTANMLGLFYTYRNIDFEQISEGQSVTIPITNPDGSSDRVVITYNGKSQYQIGATTYPTYDTVFEYSYHGTMSGYPVNCQVGANDRIPLYFAANLPVGHVEMIYSE